MLARFVILSTLLAPTVIHAATTTAPATTQTHKITEFQDAYRFLSNFFPAEVIYEDIKYSTAEHAYQAAKTLDANSARRSPLSKHRPKQRTRAGRSNSATTGTPPSSP